MATLLDTNLVSFLTPVFVFLLLFAIFYGLIKKTKLFGDKSENLAAIISLSLSLLVVFSVPGSTIVTTMTPMIVVLFLLVFLGFMFFLFLGVKEQTLVEKVFHTGGFYSTIIIAFIIIFLIALSQGFGPIFQVSGAPGFWNSTKRALFSPRVLGALFLLTISAFAVRYLGSTK